MAEQYDNTNSFALFKNDKGDNESRPDYTGNVTLEGGKEMRMACWIRESKSGLKFLSGRLSEPMPKDLDAPNRGTGPRGTATKVSENGYGDNASVEGQDVPF